MSRYFRFHFHWHDIHFFPVDLSEHARDILNFLLNYIPDRPSSGSSLPVHLTRVPEDTIRDRSKCGFSGRTLVTIGHSFGGCASYVCSNFITILSFTYQNAIKSTGGGEYSKAFLQSCTRRPSHRAGVQRQGSASVVLCGYIVAKTRELVQ